MTDSCEAKQVILQENGIIRDKSGNFLGRMVEDIDAMCEEQYKRGRIHEREACLAIVETHPTVREMSIAIRARSKHDTNK